MSKLQEKPSALKRQHAALQKMKFFNFLFKCVGNFCPLGSESNPDPDPDQVRFKMISSLREPLSSQKSGRDASSSRVGTKFLVLV